MYVYVCTVLRCGEKNKRDAMQCECKCDVQAERGKQKNARCDESKTSVCVWRKYYRCEVVVQHNLADNEDRV